jgi:hypothetical protein
LTVNFSIKMQLAEKTVIVELGESQPRGPESENTSARIRGQYYNTFKA